MHRDVTEAQARVAIDDGTSRTLLLASPENTDWLAGVLQEEGADDLADAFRHAAQEARQLYVVAFSSAIATIRGLLAIIDELLGQARRELKEWSTTEELCDWLGIEVSSLRWLHYRGEGPQRHKVGKENRYRRRDVEQWLSTRLTAEVHV